MSATPCDPLEATRVADIDPMRGIERRRPACDSDATVIGALSRVAEATSKRTARFVPELGASGAEDLTSAWRGGARAARCGRGALLDTVRRRLRASARPLRAAALAALTLTAASIAVLGLPRERAERTAPPTPAHAVDAEGGHRAAEHGAADGPRTERVAANAHPARVADLVDALSDGRLDDARGICRTLRGVSPNDEALRATAEILELAPEGGGP
jgi:hypothetical protein